MQGVIKSSVKEINLPFIIGLWKGPIQHIIFCIIQEQQNEFYLIKSNVSLLLFDWISKRHPISRNRFQLLQCMYNLEIFLM